MIDMKNDLWIVYGMNIYDIILHPWYQDEKEQNTHF